MSKTDGQTDPRTGPVASGEGPGTRERLLAAAVVVGGRHGWGGITTRAVAAEAGVQPGVVHYHLGSVARLRREAVARALSELARESIDALSSIEDPAAALVALVPAMVGAPGEQAAMVHEAYLAASRDPEVRALLADALTAVRSDLARWVDAVTAGRPGRHDPAAVATALAATLDGLYLHRLLDPDLDVAAAARPLAALLGERPGTPS